MTIEYPDYYTHFHCIADKCPDTCCAGWEVDLDDETWYRYLVVPGPFGERLRRNMKDDGTWKYFALTRNGNCPFLLPDHLCEIYERLGETALCTTCREHPRYFVDCGDYEQRDLSLGCPEVARIFFAEEGKIIYVKENKEGGAEKAEGDDRTDEGSDEDEMAGIETEEVDIKRRNQILRDRNRVLYILQEKEPGEGGGFPARMRAAGVWLPEKDDKLLRLAEEMEPLNEEWKTAVRKMKAAAEEGTEGTEEYYHIPQKWLTRLACYFVFRYWIDACYIEEDSEADDHDADDRAAGQADVGQLSDPGAGMGHLLPQIRLLNRSLRLVDLLYAAQEEPRAESREPCAAQGHDKKNSVQEIAPHETVPYVAGKDSVPQGKQTDEAASQPQMQHIIKAAYLFSRAVEFDEDNVNKLKEE